MTWKKKELKLDIEKTFQVLVLFGFNHSSNSNQVKKAGLWSNPRLLFGPFRRKRNSRLWSVLGPVGWREPVRQQLHQGGTFMAQFQPELEEQ